MKRLKIDAVVDTFVDFVNSSPRRLKLEDEIASSVADRSADDLDFWEWSIRPYTAGWVPEMEARLPRPFPEVFRSLVSRYIFPEFEWRSVSFFGNTPEKIGYEGHELRVALFRDARLFEVLSANGYIQFGQPDTGSYDPVCLAPAAGGRSDGPVVWLDHEEILIRGRIVTLETISPSFREFLQAPASN